jgi:ABC-type nitrate/sulfonate/bicarbonate transport system substrate-binding protein
MLQSKQQHRVKNGGFMSKIVGGILAIFLLQTSTNAADKIRITYPTLGNIFVTLPLAQKKGFFRAEGLEAEMIQVRGRIARAGFLSGEIDYYAGFGSMISSAIVGLPVKIVACYVPALPNMLIARPEIKSVQALKGQTVMVSGFGGDPHIVARLILEHFGVDPDKDVKFVPGPPPEGRLAALHRGLVSATIVGPPLDAEAKKLGLNILARSQDIVSYPVSGLITTVKQINEKPDEIKSVIKAGIRANRYIRTDREGTIQFLMEWQGISRDVAASTYDSVRNVYSNDGTPPEEGLRLVIEEAKKAINLDRQVSITDIADLSILKRAQLELGINKSVGDR